MRIFLLIIIIVIIIIVEYRQRCRQRPRGGAERQSNGGNHVEVGGIAKKADGCACDYRGETKSSTPGAGCSRRSHRGLFRTQKSPKDGNDTSIQERQIQGNAHRFFLRGSVAQRRQRRSRRRSTISKLPSSRQDFVSSRL